jgi:hypothetical protein
MKKISMMMMRGGGLLLLILPQLLLLSLLFVHRNINNNTKNKNNNYLVLLFMCLIIISVVCCLCSGSSSSSISSSSSGKNHFQLRNSVYDELPDNTPAARFLKYSFTRLDEGDVKSLALVMKNAYMTLCAEMHGCERAAAELEDLFQMRFNELQVNQVKMSKLGMLLRRLVIASGV